MLKAIEVTGIALEGKNNGLYSYFDFVGSASLIDDLASSSSVILKLLLSTISGNARLN